LVKATKDEYQMFYLWITDRLTYKDIESEKNLLFEKDYKKILEEWLGIDLD